MHRKWYRQESCWTSYAIKEEAISSNSIIDVWRNFHGTQRQYTWAHAHNNQLSLARLDRFNAFKHQLSMFRECMITPVCFSDHSLIKCVMTSKDGNIMENVKKKKNLLTELLGWTTQGTIIRSWYQSVELMDAPSNFLFIF